MEKEERSAKMWQRYPLEASDWARVLSKVEKNKVARMEILRKIYESRMFKGETLEKIAQRYGCSRQNIENSLKQLGVLLKRQFYE